MNKILYLGICLGTLWTTQLLAQVNPCKRHFTYTCDVTPHYSLQIVAPPRGCLGDQVFAEANPIRHVGRLLATGTNEYCEIVTNQRVYTDPIILSNWWIAIGPGAVTNSGSGLAAAFSVGNSGTGTLTFYLSYTNHECPAGGVVTLSTNYFITNCDCYSRPSGLVGWWPANSNATDVISGNTGTLMSGTHYTNGAVDLAFAFDGYHDGIAIADNTNLHQQNFTISLWVQRSAEDTVSYFSDNAARLFGYGNPGYALNLLGGVPHLSGGGISVQASFSISDLFFHHLAVTKNGTNIVFYLDGLARTVTHGSGTFTFTNDLGIGSTADGSALNFAGNIDEVQLYNRALSQAEITALYGDPPYGFCSPATPSGPVSQIVCQGSPATFTVTVSGTPPYSYQWRFNEVAIPSAISNAYTINAAQTNDQGSYSVVVYDGAGAVVSTNATLALSPPISIMTSPTSQALCPGDAAVFNATATGSGLSYQWQKDGANVSGSNIVGSTTSSLTVQSVTGADAGSYSVQIIGTCGSTNSAFATLTVLPTGAILWLRADAGITNNVVSTWMDQTTNHHDAIQYVAGIEPLLVTNAVNGLPVVRFNPTNSQFISLQSFFYSTSQSEVFAVLKVAVAVPAVNRGLWILGATGAVMKYPSTTGSITDTYGSTISRNIGSPLHPLDQYHLYNVAAANNQWSAWINGDQQYTTTVNSYSGGNGGARLGYGYGGYFDGDVAEMVIFNRVLSQTERDAVGTYLGSKYNLSSSPTAPTNLTATAVWSNQISLSWTSWSLNNSSTTFTIERKKIGFQLPHYTTVATVQDATSYLDTNLGTGVHYYYRVKASNSIGESGYSNEADATTLLPSATPIFSSYGGRFLLPQVVQISHPHTNAIIYYTTNAVTPTNTDIVIASGSSVTVDHNLTLMARAFETNTVPSAVRGAQFTFEDTAGDGVPDYIKIDAGVDLINPVYWTPPGPDPTDHIAPNITLDEPVEATLIP